MAHEGELRDEPAHGLVRSRGVSGRGGDDDEGPVPVATVVLYQAPECGLCEHALQVVRRLGADLGFELEVVDITDDPELEARYRVEIPVVEIDGERAFAYFVDEHELRERLLG